MHHKAFGGRVPSEPAGQLTPFPRSIAGFREGPRKANGVRGKKVRGGQGGKRKSSPLSIIDNRLLTYVRAQIYSYGAHLAFRWRPRAMCLRLNSQYAQAKLDFHPACVG